jgi:hypothetical protein
VGAKETLPNPNPNLDLDLDLDLVLQLRNDPGDDEDLEDAEDRIKIRIGFRPLSLHRLH